MPKNWCLQTVVLEKTPESPLDSKEIKPVNLKGNQPWILIGRTYAEAEAPVFWSSDVNSWETGNVPDAGKDWRKKEKRASEVEIAGWHHWCNGCEFGQTLGDEEGQGGLAYRSSWDHKELDRLGDWTMTGPKKEASRGKLLCDTSHCWKCHPFWNSWHFCWLWKHSNSKYSHSCSFFFLQLPKFKRELGPPKHEVVFNPKHSICPPIQSHCFSYHS